MTNIKYVTLPNGLKVIYEKSVSSIPITSVQAFCNIGNVHSPQGFNGITHFIEHMCFKGTKDHPDFNKIILDYANVGAEWNGFSTARYTYYLIKCQDLLLEKCIKHMSEGILDSKFDLANLKKEEKVVIEENIRYNDKPEEILDKLICGLLYENTLFQYPTDDISYHKKKYDYNVVKSFYKRVYIPSNMIVSVTSNLSFAKILTIIKKSSFNKKIGLKSREEESIHHQMIPLLLSPPFIQGVKYKFYRMDKQKSIHLSLSFQTCSQYNTSDKYVLNLLANILCNSTASRLALTLRQKYGLVYGISASTNYFECGGDFRITTQFNSSSFIVKNKPSVLPLIIKELNNLLTSGVTTSEVNIAKHNIRSHLLLELENINTQTYYNGLTYLLFEEPKKIVPYSDLYKTYYESITKGQINTCIKKYFCLKRMCICVVGDHIAPLHTIEAECNKLQNP